MPIVNAVKVANDDANKNAAAIVSAVQGLAAAFSPEQLAAALAKVVNTGAVKYVNGQLVSVMSGGGN